MNNLTRVYPWLVREISDNLQLKDLRRLARVCQWFRKFIHDTYDISVSHMLYREHIWQDIREFEKTNRLTHKTIRKWNPEWGIGYVYAYIYKKQRYTK